MPEIRAVISIVMDAAAAVSLPPRLFIERNRMPVLPVAAFTFGDATLTVVELAFMFLWIWIAIGVVFDIFRSSDLSNWSKALWVLFIFVFPLIGVLGYLIIRGHTMHEHQAQDHAQFAAFRQFQRRPQSGGAADDISALSDLKDRGVLTSEEFERAKAKALQ
jgi:Phospholipase_D-nuclease N-terminal/Short C-terminal domain